MERAVGSLCKCSGCKKNQLKIYGIHLKNYPGITGYEILQMSKESLQPLYSFVKSEE